LISFNRVSFKVSLSTLFSLFFILLWFLYNTFFIQSLRSSLEDKARDQRMWLKVYSQSFLDDVQTGNLNSLEKKVKTLVDKEIFTFVNIKFPENEVSFKREFKVKEKSEIYFLSKLIDVQTIKIPLEDRFLTTWGNIHAEIDTSHFYDSHESKFVKYLYNNVALLIIYIGLMIFIVNFFDFQLTNLIGACDRLNKEDLREKGPTRIRISEFSDLYKKFFNIIESRVKLEQKLNEGQKMIMLGNLSSQVAHDIRSPLAALNMVTSDLDILPEASRIMIRGAINRIQDIANNLLESNQNQLVPINKKDIYLLSPIVDSLVSEKRTQLRSKMGIDILCEFDGPYGLFANIEQAHFKRLLSNLINNSAEALVGMSGLITVSLRKLDNGDAQIIIRDNGKGIPNEILSQLGVKGASFGKESSKDSGYGLGLAHAKNSIQKWGGTFTISSHVGKGTDIIMTLPSAEFPDWFVTSIQFNNNQNIIIIDDDITIHQIWDKRLEEVLSEHKCKGNELNLNILHFSNPRDLSSWVKINGTKNTIFLCDYEFIGENTTGLDLIQSLSISNQAILVTSRYEEQEVRLKCEELSLGLIPKLVVEFVPLLVKGPVSIENIFDAVHIDDDELMRLSWQFKARKANIKILSLSSPSELEDHLHKINKDTPFYIDSCLGETEIPGQDLAKSLYEKGHQNLYLSTGYEKEHFDDMPWITDVIGKTPPWSKC
jgi:signal transduction histidine kinase